ncbi:MAG: hypothetical protein ACR2ML_06655 [Solirubrobacteraceae bacterium]
MVDGDLTVAGGVEASIHGMVTGELLIAFGAAVTLNGMVVGAIVNRGRLEVYGTVQGSRSVA